MDVIETAARRMKRTAFRGSRRSGAALSSETGVFASPSPSYKNVQGVKELHVSAILRFDPRIGEDSRTTRSGFSNLRIAIQGSIFQDVVNPIIEAISEKIGDSRIPSSSGLMSHPPKAEGFTWSCFFCDK